MCGRTGAVPVWARHIAVAAPPRSIRSAREPVPALMPAAVVDVQRAAAGGAGGVGLVDGPDLVRRPCGTPRSSANATAASATTSRAASAGQRPHDALPLDRDVDEVAPLRPRAVVVLDVVLAEQLVQDEPRVRRALADPAVGDDRVAVEHAPARVQVAQVVGALERAVLAHRQRPRHRPRAGDVAGALRALVLVAGHRDQLAGVLLRRAHVDEPRRPAERRDHLVPVRADRLVRVVGGEHARGVLRHAPSSSAGPRRSTSRAGR